MELEEENPQTNEATETSSHPTQAGAQLRTESDTNKSSFQSSGWSEVKKV